MPPTSAIRKKILNGIAITTGFIVLISLQMYLSSGFNLYTDTYYKWFGLMPSSTVADYRAASQDAKTYWLDKMCNNGVCLHRVDWACGFSISPYHPDPDFPGRDEFFVKVEVCFKSLVQKAALSETLGKLRLLCGRQAMVFASELYSTPQACTKAGGQWGEKIKVFEDENNYVVPAQ